jgi:hypothetical protein
MAVRGFLKTSRAPTRHGSAAGARGRCALFQKLAMTRRSRARGCRKQAPPLVFSPVWNNGGESEWHRSRAIPALFPNMERTQRGTSSVNAQRDLSRVAATPAAGNDKRRGPRSKDGVPFRTFLCRQSRPRSPCLILSGAKEQAEKKQARGDRFIIPRNLLRRIPVPRGSALSLLTHCLRSRRT